jgi:hypothetical protein
VRATVNTGKHCHETWKNGTTVYIDDPNAKSCQVSSRKNGHPEGSLRRDMLIVVDDE